MKTGFLSEIQHDLWQRFLKNRSRHPHASLFIGAIHTGIENFVLNLVTALLCQQSNPPCENCQSCRLMRLKQHPDLLIISSEKAGSAIKIEQIRELQQTIFTSAQLGDKKVVIINPADKMNIAAANALLKLLEEPPAHAYFFLLAEQLSTVLPTIISRCQQWHLNSSKIDWLNYYDEGTERGRIISELDSIIIELKSVLTGQLSICSLANKWTSYALDALVWILYWLVAELTVIRLSHQTAHFADKPQLRELAMSCNPVRLFELQEIFHGIIRNLNHTISVNQLLTLEEILYGFSKLAVGENN